MNNWTRIIVVSGKSLVVSQKNAAKILKCKDWHIEGDFLYFNDYFILLVRWKRK